MYLINYSVMNENIDLTKILKDCPKGWKFWSPIFGDVKFQCIFQTEVFVNAKKDGKNWSFSADATFPLGDIKSVEIMLYPSEDQRDWSKFTAPWYKKEKFDPKTLKPFDRVLIRIDGGDVYCWFADFVSAPTIEKYDLLPCIMSNKDANMIIPYNDETKHLVGTTDEAPEYYRYWED